MDRIPLHLRSRVKILENDKGEPYVFLLGTVHVLDKSVEDAKDLIQSVRPNTVFLELCEDRSGLLSTNESEDNKPMTSSEILINTGNVTAAAFSGMQQWAAKDIGSEAGGEFKAAYRAAKEINADVILGDRLIGITTERMRKGMTFFDTFYQLSMLFINEMFSKSHQLSNSNDLKTALNDFVNDLNAVNNFLETMADRLPWVAESFIFERDLFMTIELRRLMLEEPNHTIVAIVGAGHIKGMLKEWKNVRTEEEYERLYSFLQLCPKNSKEFSKTKIREYARLIKQLAHAKVQKNNELVESLLGKIKEYQMFDYDNRFQTRSPPPGSFESLSTSIKSRATSRQFTSKRSYSNCATAPRDRMMLHKSFSIVSIQFQRRMMSNMKSYPNKFIPLRKFNLISQSVMWLTIGSSINMRR